MLYRYTGLYVNPGTVTTLQQGNRSVTPVVSQAPLQSICFNHPLDISIEIGNIMNSVSSAPPGLRRMRLSYSAADDKGPADIFVVSTVDARLEAKACLPENQIYANGHVCSICAGDVILDVGANVGRSEIPINRVQSCW